MFNFTSSAIENISDVQDGKVAITFVGGRKYDYSVQDVAQFTSALNNVITKGDSVGRFVNQQIRSDALTVA